MDAQKRKEGRWVAWQFRFVGRLEYWEVSSHAREPIHASNSMLRCQIQVSFVKFAFFNSEGFQSRAKPKARIDLPTF